MTREPATPLIKRLVVIPSVWHSGTHFMTDQVVPDFTAHHFDHRGWIAGSPRGDIQVRCHCEPEFAKSLQRWGKEGQCLVPMRHPILVAQSWKARGKTGRFLELAAQWKLLKDHIAPHDPLYLPIDSPDRENWLDKIRNFLNSEIQTDWPVIMSCNKSATLTDEEREAVIEVMADGFFDRFGYSI